MASSSFPNNKPSPPDTGPAAQNNQQQRTAPPLTGEDLIDNIRRFADYHISTMLHSLIGLPSMLSTPGPGGGGAGGGWMLYDEQEERQQQEGRNEGKIVEALKREYDGGRVTERGGTDGRGGINLTGGTGGGEDNEGGRGNGKGDGVEEEVLALQLKQRQERREARNRILALRFPLATLHHFHNINDPFFDEVFSYMFGGGFPPTTTSTHSGSDTPRACSGQPLTAEQQQCVCGNNSRSHHFQNLHQSFFGQGTPTPISFFAFPFHLFQSPFYDPWSFGGSGGRPFPPMREGGGGEDCGEEGGLNPFMFYDEIRRQWDEEHRRRRRAFRAIQEEFMRARIENEQEEAKIQTQTQGRKDIMPSSGSGSETELDAYEQLISRGETKPTSNDTQSQLEISPTPAPLSPANKRLLSTSTTTQTHTLPDGSQYTRTIIEKGYSDGTTERIENEYSVPPSSGTNSSRSIPIIRTNEVTYQEDEDDDTDYEDEDHNNHDDFEEDDYYEKHHQNDGQGQISREIKSHLATTGAVRRQLTMADFNNEIEKAWEEFITSNKDGDRRDERLRKRMFPGRPSEERREERGEGLGKVEKVEKEVVIEPVEIIEREEKVVETKQKEGEEEREKKSGSGSGWFWRR